MVTNKIPVIKLEQDLTIYTAAEVKNKLLKALKKSTDMELDLSGVNEMDTAGLQVLIALKRECQIRGGELKLTGHSSAVIDVLELCHMHGFFGDPVVITAQTHS